MYSDDKQIDLVLASEADNRVGVLTIHGVRDHFHAFALSGRSRTGLYPAVEFLAIFFEDDGEGRHPRRWRTPCTPEASPSLLSSAALHRESSQDELQRPVPGQPLEIRRRLRQCFCTYSPLFSRAQQRLLKDEITQDSSTRGHRRAPRSRSCALEEQNPTPVSTAPSPHAQNP